MVPLWAGTAIPIAPLCGLRLACGLPIGDLSMLDILLLVLGTGGILAMLPYAALCDRI